MGGTKIERENIQGLHQFIGELGVSVGGEIAEKDENRAKRTVNITRGWERGRVGGGTRGRVGGPVLYHGTMK